MDGEFFERGTQPFTFNELCHQLDKYKNSFLSLQFSQHLLYEAIGKGLSSPDYNPSFRYYSGDAFKAHNDGIYDPTNIQTIDLQNHLLGEVLGDMVSRFTKQGFLHNLPKHLVVNNFHFIRTKFINSIYEVLEKYIKKFASLTGQKDDKGFCCSLRKELRNEDWYVMLYLLRNNASHSDNIQTPVVFKSFLKKLNKETISWKTIEVKNGMYGHKIRYNDEELLELYNEMIEYIIANHKIFITSLNGKVISELIET